MSTTRYPTGLGMSDSNMEPGTMRVYVTHGPRIGFNIGGKVGPCPGTGAGGCWECSCISQATHTANTYRPRFQVIGPDIPKPIICVFPRRYARPSRIYIYIYIYIHIYIHIYIYMHTLVQCYFCCAAPDIFSWEIILPLGCSLQCSSLCEHVCIFIYMYSQSHLKRHFRKLFQRSKLKAWTSLFTETWQKRRSSFELWALKQLSKMSHQVGSAVYILV